MNARLRRGGRSFRLMLATALVVAVAAAVLVGARTEITSLRYELAGLSDRRTQLQLELEKLRVEEAALSAPERIEPRARGLGLRYPGEGQVIRRSLPAVAAGAGR